MGILPIMAEPINPRAVGGTHLVEKWVDGTKVRSVVASSVFAALAFARGDL